MDYLAFIEDAHSEDTGGGMECDVLRLVDGTILVISEEAIVLYPNIEAWESGREASLGTILRKAAFPEGG